MSVKFKVPIIVDGQVTAEYLDLSTTTVHSVNAGEIAWNAVDGTFDVGMLNGVTLQEGQEMYFYAKATEAILNGDAVMFAGVQGDHLLIARADRSVLNANPNYFMGVATQRFEVNDFGYVTAFGKVRGLDTTAYTLGATLYYDSTSPAAGLLTETMPSAAQAKIEVAAVVRVHATQGVLMVRPHIMPILNQIQDVDVTLSKVTPIDADSLFLQDTADQDIWKKLSWSNVKATLKTYFDTLYQKGTGTTNYVSKFTGTTTLGNSQLFDNGTNVGIGTTTPTALGTNIKTLDIKGSSGGGIRIGVSGGSESTFYTIAAGGYLGTISNIPLNFQTNNSVKATILANGNVGFGTTSPGVKFVNSGSAFSSGPTLGSGTVGSQALLSNNGLYGMYSGVSDNGDVWQQVQRNDGNSAVYNIALQPSGGNIYIGTTTPVYGTSSRMQFLFDGLNEFGMNFRSTAVNSIPIHFTSSTGTQTGYVFQDATSVFLVSVSDYRLKEDLNPFNGLDLISKINVYDYKWKNQDKRSFGVMAHELQEVIPQAAFGEKDGERMQGVDYSILVPILIKSVQELNDLVKNTNK